MEGARARLEAPAKLNLGLRVLGPRKDGLHGIESLFLPLAAPTDRVELERAGPGISLEVRGPAPAPPGPDNLAWRAAEAFFREAKFAPGVSIRLEKQIPAPGGLGGGSSDAGAVLRGLQRLYPGALPEARLPALAFDLGADVPYFLQPLAALVEGAGERVQPLSGLPRLHLALALPVAGFSTAEVFAAHRKAPARLTDSGPRPTLRALLQLPEPPAGADGPGPGGGAGDAEGVRRSAALPPVSVSNLAQRVQESGGLSAWVCNDLEAAAMRLCPELALLKAALADAGAEAVGMSGAGPAVYGIFSGAGAEARAQRAAQALSGSAAFCCATHTR